MYREVILHINFPQAELPAFSQLSQQTQANSKHRYVYGNKLPIVWQLTVSPFTSVLYVFSSAQNPWPGLSFGGGSLLTSEIKGR